MFGDYKKFKVEALNDHTKFIVLVLGWFGIWKAGFVWTDYFSCYVALTKEERLMENLEYVCCHCENAQGGRRVLESFRFKLVT